MNKEKIYKDAIKANGREAQISMVFEEMAELQKELCKHLRCKTRVDCIAEEIADVTIMLEQMILLFDVAEEVEEIKEYKIKRLSNALTGWDWKQI